MTNTLSELKRRNIFRVAGVYAVAGWLLAQLASVLESSLNMPGWFDTVVVSLLLICFPVAMILAWAFGIYRSLPLLSRMNIKGFKHKLLY
jgi:hypothetical protein